MIMISIKKKYTTLLLLLLAACLTAQIKLAPIFSNYMVLQQGIEIPVWGWASPGQKIKVMLEKAVVSTKADRDGKWLVKLPAMNYGGPFKMTVKGKSLCTIENVMIGEVWICSGQSNMEFPLIRSKNGETEVAASNYPEIRLFTVKKNIAQTPQDPMQDGEWQTCSPASSPQFSAVAYFFGRALYENLKVPIGLIHSSWGGTVAETWISRQTIEKNPDFSVQLAELDKMNLDEYIKNTEEQIRIRAGQSSAVDAGMAGDEPAWAAPDLDDSTWKTMRLPGFVEQNGLEGFDGIIWFRKVIEISQTEAGQFATLHLAKVNDSDNTYLNGNLIGFTKLNAEKSRMYTIPAGLLKYGKNMLTVQVEDIAGICGIHGDSASLKLAFAHYSIPLSGDWKYKVGSLKINNVLSPNTYPTLLYNGMINTIIPFAMRGVIWYQGEGNASRARQYQRVFPDLINDWRSHWHQGEFPFLFVQLPNFMKPDSLPSQSTWAELREAQSKTLALPNTGMAVTIDVGEANDIHPKDKQTVGYRLALAAFKVAYKQDGLFSGPVYQTMAITGNKVILRFDRAGNGLKINDKYGYLKGFAVAGENRIFYWAQAKLAGPNSVEVTSPEVPYPAAVRYGWGNNPQDANLYNSADLPASPFRTDQ
jgi:sialate O-acetylesterase